MAQLLIIFALAENEIWKKEFKVTFQIISKNVFIPIQICFDQAIEGFR